MFLKKLNLLVVKPILLIKQNIVEALRPSPQTVVPSTDRVFHRKSKQLGFTMVEVLISLSVVAAATVGVNELSTRLSEDTTNTLTASQVRTFGESLNAYVKDNYATIQSATPVGGVAVLIDVPTLIASGKLAVGFTSINSLNQNICALVIQPASGRMQAMVVTEGGKKVNDNSLGSIAAAVGGNGGGVYAANASVIRGATGGWSLPITTFNNLANTAGKRCDGSAGNVQLTAGHPVMTLAFESADSATALLARDAVTGRSELNTMNTPLVLNSLQTVGNACTTQGAIAQQTSGGDGNIVVCQRGTWVTAGAGCTYSQQTDLNGLQTGGSCYNGVNAPNSPAGGDWFFLNVSRHINASNFYVSQRVVGMTGPSVGREWVRSQQSNGSGGGWSNWNQIADPQVSLSSGTVNASRGALSRDGAGPCCGDKGTLSLAEATNSTGKTASISLHNAGIHEGNIELAGSGSRRIRLYDNQGVGMGLEMTGNLSVNGGVITGGGSANSYGAVTVKGSKNGWSGQSFTDSNGNYQVTQMTNRGMVGYYDEAAGRWMEYTDTTGNQTLDQTQDYSSGRLNPGWAVETWGCTTGQIAKAAYTVAAGWNMNGTILSCISGVWKAPIF